METPGERTYRLRAEAIKELLTARRMSQKRLADRIEVTPKTLRGWLNGARAYARNVIALADALDVQIESIVEPFISSTQTSRANPVGSLSVSLNIGCTDPNEFMYLCELLADIRTKLEAYRELMNSKIRVHFLRGTDTETGHPAYFFLVCRAELHDRLLSCLASGEYPTFAAVVARGYGEPDATTWSYMKQEWAFELSEASPTHFKT